MKIAIIGAGNMGGAIARGVLRSRFIAAEDLTIVDPHTHPFEGYGIRFLHKIDNSITDCDAVIIAVKPWIAPGVINELSVMIGPKRITICSIVAGVECATLRQSFTTQPLLRIMPNTAVSVAEGMTFVAADGATEGELKLATDMFGTLGKVKVIEEGQMVACMALASCGVAYAMRYVRAAMEGGIELGLPASTAQSVIVQTLRGAAALLEGGSHPEVEIDKVTTPGGITIKGLNAMEANGFTNAVIEGLKASR